MARPSVFNRYHKNAPEGSVYIGRGSPWGNPFEIGKDGTRDEVCDKFKEMVERTPEFREAVKRELKGKNLVCFCKPRKCHGDYLLDVANSGD